MFEVFAVVPVLPEVLVVFGKCSHINLLKTKKSAHFKPLIHFFL